MAVHRDKAKFWLLLWLAMSVSSCATFRDLFGDGQVVETAAGVCIDLTPENKLHPVGSCEKESTYEFRVLDRQYVYTKSVFQEKLKRLLLYAVASTPYPVSQLRDADIEVWLVSPIFQPDESHLFVVVSGEASGQGGSFGFPLPLAMERWEIRRETFVLLGSKGFPSRSARRGGSLMVELNPYVEARSPQVAAWIHQAGGSPVERSSMVLQVETPVFGEASVAAALKRHPKARRYLRQIHFIPAGHVEGAKARSARFSFSGRRSQQSEHLSAVRP